MSSTQALTDLAVTSVKEPAAAARRLLSMDLEQSTLWTALLLMAVLNTLIQQVSNLFIDIPTPLLRLFDVAIIYFLFVAGGLILIVFAVFWTGRIFGGRGSLEDIMVVIVWLQFLRVLVQASALILLLTIPFVSFLFVIGATMIGCWIFVHFVNEAHEFDNLGKSAVVLIAAFAGMLVGLSLLLSLVGFGSLGLVNV
ncbi:MAG: Yip1 family protein [Aestuariivita sp.]|nr:Yip1 family protein [Aestuariivita sp.]MCY4201066.1 Yip1 family protein [Aestuariivita sp.]MCY4288868.1 Yip1 family protein [Aestuariivita sp.]MCY4345222.1 Yip1 family protein [Aestuariivita sp.]